MVAPRTRDAARTRLLLAGIGRLALGRDEDGRPVGAVEAQAGGSRRSVTRQPRVLHGTGAGPGLRLGSGLRPGPAPGADRGPGAGVRGDRDRPVGSGVRSGLWRD